MNKKHKCKKQAAKQPQTASKILLTFSTARMLKDALRLTQESFSQNTAPLPNLELAHDTLEGLQRKLDDMLQCEELERETPLDYNEIHILSAALHIYLAYLKMKREHALMTTCLLLCKQFSFLINQLNGT